MLVRRWVVLGLGLGEDPLTRPSSPIPAAGTTCWPARAAAAWDTC
jgi:hypothetical protein